MPYAAMVFNEALRLYPPAWIMARDVLQVDEIEGWHIPAGSLIFLSPYVTHRRAEDWGDPLAFNPLRFSPGNSAGRPRFAYFPFGGGQRQCLGKNFALIEAQLALPLMVRKYRFSLAGQAGPRNTPYPIYNYAPSKNHLPKTRKALKAKPGPADTAGRYS
jgi:cytochrome P450